MDLRSNDGENQVRRRTRRDPRPRFKPDVTTQLDAVCGCPELQVPEGHLARQVKELLGLFDLSEVEAKYSSLGRHAFQPRHKLAVWVYASLIGLHHGSEISRALETDAAFRFLSGGYWISSPVLNVFRRENEELFSQAIEASVAMAQQAGMLKPDQLAIDSVRLRADASFKAVRTLERSKQRIEELTEERENALPEATDQIDRKLVKYQSAVERCEAEGRTNIVVTNELAGFMKFPNAGGVPGHRVTVTAAGVKERLVVSVLIDGDTQDQGKLGPSLEKTRELFERIGAPTTGLQAAADAGYWTRPDLEFARANRGWVDVLIDEATTTSEHARFYSRKDFTIDSDGNAICPAGVHMRKHSQGKRVRYLGVGCEDCALKPKCTDSKRRMLTLRPDYEVLRNAMQHRMAQPDASARYHKRMATVEPVFANLEDVMRFRRLSTRQRRSVVAEILLKILAHNISRLLSARRSRSRLSLLTLVLEF
jgi:transposase